MQVPSYNPAVTTPIRLRVRPGCACDGAKGADRAEAGAVADLRARDREVRSHEQAHRAAGGRYVSGGVHLDYQRGPDGRYYAVGGDVSVSTSPVPGDPQATLRKMAAVRRAALAPAEPSSQDLKVAAQAAVAASRARLALNGAQGGDARGTDPAKVSEAAENMPDHDDGGRPATPEPAPEAVRAYGAIAAVNPDAPGRLLDLRA